MRQFACPVDPDAPPTGTTPPVNDAPPTEDGDDADQQPAPQLDPPIEGERQTPPPQSPDVEEPPRRPPPGEVEPDNSDETPQEQTGGGDPVDLFSGRFTLREVDLQLNTSVLPLEMVRTYQSGQSYFGPFGWGWDHNHNRYLRELINGGVAHWTGDLNEEIHMPEGGGWRAAPGVFHVLERLGGPATRYVLKAPEGLESTFEQPPGWTDGERIPLVKVADRFGNTLVYTYDARSRLSMVTDDDGRFLAFHYGDCDLLEAVEDQAGRRVVYEHHNDLEHLACVRLPATDDHPDGLRRTFEYAPASLPQPLRHAITRIRDGDGLVFLENRYEQDPSSFSYGRVIEQLAADYLYQFRYTQLQYVPAHADFLNIPSVRVELMTPDFALYTHTYNYRGDLLDYRFRLVADKSFRVVASSFGYDTEGNRIRTTLPDGSGELRRFSHTDPDPRMRGKLRQIELRARAGFPSPSRMTLRIDYEPNFQLVKRIRDERGGSTDYVYDLDTAPVPGAVGKLERIILPDAVLPDGSVQNSDIRLKIDARGRLEELTSALGHTQRYIYGGPGPEAGLPVQTIRDVGGLDITETISRDANGNVASTEDGMGERTELIHDALDRLVQIAMPDVAGKRGIVRLNYDTQGDLVALWRPRGDYDDAVLAGAPITDTLTRNVQGHIVSTTFGANTANPITQTQKTDYRGLVLCATGPEGTVTQQCFDERGLLLERTETGADGSTTKQQWVYDRAGRLQVMRSGQDSPTETRYDYDAFGRLAKVTLPDGAEQSYEYGPGDSILDEQLRGNDGTGMVRLLARKSQTYDARGRVVTETRHAFEDDPTTAQLLTVSNTFDGDDRLIETEDHRGVITRMDYDRANRLTALTDAAGNRTEHQYDAAGRRTRTRTIDLEDGGSVQRDTLFTYDGRGRLSRMTLPGGEVTDYDYDDRNTQVRILAPLGFEQRQRFGQLGELLERTVDPSGVNASHRWTYDKSLRPLSYSDPVGDVTRFFHDGLGRMVRTTLPNGFESKRSYSQDGRVATETVSGGGVIKLGYDAAGRLSQMQGGASPISANIADHSFAYDARGHITRASADGLITRRKFDSLGRLVEDSTDGLTHRNSFDDLSGTIDRHWSDGRHERIESDVMGRPTKIEQLAPGTVASDVADLAQFSLAGPMSVEQRTLFGSITTATRFDASRRVLDQEVTAGGGAIETQAYRYDALGRTNIAQSALQGWTRVAEHDGPSRLRRTAEGFVAPPLSAGASSVAEQATDIGAVQAAAAGAARTREFTYDRSDARLTRSENGAAPDVYTYAAGKMMTAAAAEVMSNDANARRTGDGRNRYEYDAFGRVTRILTQNGAAERMRMTYDALGRLQQSQTDGGPIHRHGHFGQVEVEEHAGGALLRQFSADPYLPLPLAVHQGGSSFAALNDQRLNRVGLADTTGNVVERYSFARSEPHG
ncbi:MAG: hypothetical protein GKR99_15795 [Rhodobacteraceae bacterium]|nr:hypothetical protein [Paracoccaceae bacterium]